MFLFMLLLTNKYFHDWLVGKKKISKPCVSNRLHHRPVFLDLTGYLGDTDCGRSSRKTRDTRFKFTDFAERAYSTTIDCSNSEFIYCSWNKILFLK